MPELVKVATLSDIPPGTTHRVYADDRWICLYNVAGEIHATADECSHAVASLCGGSLEGHIIRCPRHGATFDVRTGKNLSFPAVTPVKHFAVSLEGEDIYLAL
ncbi:MAG: non-heme iron oxygenase ferredoxin subunit [Armatimonadetes bacterium]|nr:non-heme iron oxygenase ferredoxin subunit [Armatimonadota bacterium]